MKKIDRSTYPRNDLVAMYRAFDCSRYSVTLELDVTELREACARGNCSFFGACLYAFLKANNEVPAFRMRLIEEEIYDVETVAAATTLMAKGSEIFTFVNIPYEKEFTRFMAHLDAARQAVENGASPASIPAVTDTTSMVCLNCAPSVSFTSISFPYHSFHQTMPVITWGKCTLREGRQVIPYAMQINHMFIDGYHIGQFAENLEETVRSLAAGITLL